MLVEETIDIPILDVQNDLGSASSKLVSKYEADVDELRAAVYLILILRYAIPIPL